uniref:Uncharacterized protein n=1 Tax=Prasinoderma coloniale TaxID=156133 RepID=A0A7R9TIU0_9VIRI
MPGKGGSGKGGGSGTGATGAAGVAGAAGAAAAKPARRRGNKELAKQKRGVFSSGAAGGGKGEALPKKNDGNPLQCPYCEKIYKQDGRLKEHLKRQHADEVAAANKEAEAKAEEVAAAKAAEDARRAKEPPRAARGEKLPKVLLREACDKAKRIPPRYRETRCNDPPDTWHSKCVLADKKVANNDIVCFTKGKCEPQPSAMEASQMAAVVALHRLCAGLQMHRVLPKRYRPLWEVLDEGREEREEKAALRAKREEKRKEREARQQQREERERRQVTSVYMSPDRLEVIKGLLDGVAGAGAGAGAGRPGLDDGKRSTEGDWDDSDGEGGDGGDARPDVDDLATQLSSMGFDANDASTAARRHPGELSAALDWLLLTLDDESLPARFAARGSAKHIDVRVMRPARAQGAAMDAEADPSPALEDPGWPTDAGAAPSTQLPDAAAEELEALGAIYADELAAGDGGSADTPEGCYALTLAEGDASVQMRWRFPEGYPERAPLHLRVAAIAGVGPNALAEMGAAASARASALQADGEVAVFELAEMLKEQLRRPTRELTSKTKASTADDVREERDVRRGAEDAPPQKPPKPPRRHSPRQPQQRREAGPRVSESERRAENERLRALEEDRRAGRGPGAALAAVRARLPAAGSRDEVLTALARARVLIIHGATGCGKSTQVPQFILEAEAAAGRGGAASVVVTQPRRISAVGVAERVAAERGEPCGDVVGYTVRLDRKASRRTRLMFCTTGVLLRRLQSDPLLRDVTHVVVDEVHERSVECDLLLLLLRQALTRNDALKVVLMSATLDAEAFAEYFARPTGGSADGDDKGIGSRPVPLPPVVTIPGFTHPVRDLYLEDVLELTRFRIGAKNRYTKRTTSAMPSASRDQVGGGRSTTDAASRQGAAQQRLSTLADKSAAAAAEAKPAVLRLPGAELDSWEDDDGDVGADSDVEEASTAAERERAEAAAAAARGQSVKIPHGGWGLARGLRGLRVRSPPLALVHRHGRRAPPLPPARLERAQRPAAGGAVRLARRGLLGDAEEPQPRIEERLHAAEQRRVPAVGVAQALVEHVRLAVVALVAVRAQLRRVRLAAEGGVEQAHARVPPVGHADKGHAADALQRALQVVASQRQVARRGARVFRAEVVPSQARREARVARPRVARLRRVREPAQHHPRLAAAHAGAHGVVQRADPSRRGTAAGVLAPARLAAARLARAPPLLRPPAAQRLAQAAALLRVDAPHVGRPLVLLPGHVLDAHVPGVHAVQVVPPVVAAAREPPRGVAEHAHVRAHLGPHGAVDAVRDRRAPALARGVDQPRRARDRAAPDGAALLGAPRAHVHVVRHARAREPQQRRVEAGAALGHVQPREGGGAAHARCVWGGGRRGAGLAPRAPPPTPRRTRARRRRPLGGGRGGGRGGGGAWA